MMDQAEDNRRLGEQTIVFVDEIHRFNKAQQDAFLPFVEKGSIILIGATTENPSFEINWRAALPLQGVRAAEPDGGGPDRAAHARAVQIPAGLASMQVDIDRRDARDDRQLCQRRRPHRPSTPWRWWCSTAIAARTDVTVTKETLEQCITKQIPAV